jgi:hypothetical protein
LETFTALEPAVSRELIPTSRRLFDALLPEAGRTPCGERLCQAFLKGCLKEPEHRSFSFISKREVRLVSKTPKEIEEYERLGFANGD